MGKDEKPETELPERNGDSHQHKKHAEAKAKAQADAAAQSKKGKKRDTDSDNDSDADSSDSEGSRMAAERQPGEFINIAYDDLVGWLGDWLVGQKPPEWIKSWSTTFKRMLPLHTFLRTQSAFKEIVAEYRELDPRKQEHTPLVSAIPDKRVRQQRRRELKKELHVESHQTPQGELPAASEKFMNGRLQALLRTCGFTRLPPDFLKVAMKEQSRHGLDVHVPDQTEVPCHVYYRDDYEKKATVKSWQTCFRNKEVVDRYLRQVVLVYAYTFQKDDAPEGCCSKLHWYCGLVRHRRAVGSPESEGKVYVRCYDNIPLADLDMMMPGSKPNPKVLDALIVLVPFLGGLGAALWKIVGIFHDTDDLTDVANLMVILFAIIGPFMVSFKAFMKAKNKLTEYRCKQAQTLVDKTVSTNRGTMMQLLAEAADQENKEAVLAYTTLALQRDPQDAAGVREHCNGLLRTASPHSNTDFDADDAVQKLVHVGMLDMTARGKVQTVDIDVAREKLSLAQFETPKPPKLRTN